MIRELRASTRIKDTRNSMLSGSRKNQLASKGYLLGYYTTTAGVVALSG